jgi:hypothetical protein
MTISTAQRLANLELALKFFIRDLEGHAINLATFASDEPKYKEILPTTWEELRQRFLLTQLRHTDMHRLTGLGWYAGVKASGLADNPEFKRQMRKLAATLKSYVKGRHEPELVTLGDVERDSGLSQEFIYNAIESQLLDREFNKKGADWTQQSDPKIVIRVPVNFGHEPL